MTFAQTAIFEDVDLLAGGVADVAAHEAADGPAHGRIGATEVQEMLLRLVGCEQHRPLLGERVLTSRLGAEEPLEGVDAGAGATPFLVARPLELLSAWPPPCASRGRSRTG